MRLPRRKWVVENQPAITKGPWKHSLGPYFRKKTAEGYMSRMRWFVPYWLINLRVKNLGEE